MDGWKPRSISRFATSIARMPVASFSRLPVATNSCIGRPSGTRAGKSSDDERRQVVRVQRGELAHRLQPVGAVQEHVGVCADQDADVAVEAVETTDRARTVVVPSERARHVVACDDRRRQVGHQLARPPPTGPAPGPPPPCGVANVLCVLMCTMSKPMSPGRHSSEDGVEVRAVVVHERPRRRARSARSPGSPARTDRACSGWSASARPPRRRRASRARSTSTRPRASEGTGTAWNPARVHARRVRPVRGVRDDHLRPRAAAAPRGTPA